MPMTNEPFVNRTTGPKPLERFDAADPRELVSIKMRAGRRSCAILTPSSPVSVSMVW
jgi:hypothetical protein